MPRAGLRRALNGHRVALALSQVVAERGTPESITAGNELSTKATADEEYTSAMACRASIEATITRGREDNAPAR
jgi:hypothetical protein